MMKYVIFRDISAQLIGTRKWPKGGQVIDINGYEHALIFPDGITHSVMTELLQKIYPGLLPVAAGFCDFSEDGWHCEGHSVSLKLKSRGMLDASVIRDSLWHDINEDNS